MKEAKPVTNVVLKHKEKQTLEEFAVVLESIAKKLKEKGEFTFTQGGEAISIAPGRIIKAEYEYTTKGNKHSFEIEIDWYEGEEELKSMSIE
ncbi:MAG: amphi-Trp domain-containing protein [Bacillus sp. (in: Bacteria)]|nr:amphi-Trp domain-containing protein [Bacillus sp. (in: firmicutes)]